MVVSEVALPGADLAALDERYTELARGLRDAALAEAEAGRVDHVTIEVEPPYDDDECRLVLTAWTDSDAEAADALTERLNAARRESEQRLGLAVGASVVVVHWLEPYGGE